MSDQQKQISPLHPLALMGMTLAFLILFSMFWPEQEKAGIKYVENYSTGNIDTVQIYKREFKYVMDNDSLKFKFFSFSDMIPLGKEVEVKIEEHVAEAEKFEEYKAEDIKVVDTTHHKDSNKVVKINLDKILAKKMRVQYNPKSNNDALYNFFKSLKEEAPEKLVRISHYGDSQLEGDRISSQLRNELQNKFGGCGCGFIPVEDAKSVYRVTTKMEASDNWNKRLVYGTKYKKDNPRHYSSLGSYFFFTPQLEDKIDLSEADSSNRDSIIAFNKRIDSLYLNMGLRKAWVKYSMSKRTYANNKRFDNAYFYYGSSKYPWRVKMSKGTDTLMNFNINSSSGFNKRPLSYLGDYTDLTLSFEAKHSPEIYGVSFDCNKGIALDNMGLRGAAGLEVMRIGPNLATEIKVNNVKLIIFQFGINTVPGDIDDYNYFYNLYNRPLRYLRKIAPQASILVVGVSDMSKNVEGTYLSYENIETLRNAQKNAAFKNGCGFFDLYAAMGGKNSMPSWVEKGLADDEHTHFSSSGARVVSKMIYRALMLEYEVYKKLGN